MGFKNWDCDSRVQGFGVSVVRNFVAAGFGVWGGCRVLNYNTQVIPYPSFRVVLGSVIIGK